MFTPQLLSLQATIGDTFDPVLILYTDAAQLDPLDLSDYTAVLEIGEALTLTPGAGLTLGGEAGTLQILLTDAQTGALEPATLRWFLRLTNTALEAVSPGSGVGTPVKGNISFEAP